MHVASALCDGQDDGENLGLGIGYHPNPFVNPNQRGVELPPGCKDLMDVLKMDAGERPGAESQMVWYGALSEVEQYVRDFLEEIRWNKQPPAPALPAEVARRTSEKYVEAYRQLTGRELDV